VIGSVLRKIVVARFTRTLGTLLSSGVPILDALDICAKTSGNRVVQRGIMHSRAKISEGQDMAGPLGDTKVFPTMVTQMIGVGEQTGAMDQMLQKIADFYEDEVDTAVAGLMKLIEPVMITVLGAIIGMLLRKIAVARFCRTLATLTSSGVPILDGLEITAKTAGNAIIEDAVMSVRKSVEEGKTISEPLGETKVFPAMVVQMINVGEQTGALDQMLSKIADFYEDEVDTAVAGLMKLIEPLMISVLGVVIGTIVAAMYLPLYSILNQIG
jgi:type II secretory pathway component PulF